MKVPIIVINWNGYNDTVECIHSVLQTKGVDYEVYLVDNGSEANEGERLSKEFNAFEEVKVYLLDENIGFAKANNFILEQVLAGDYEWVALLNNDTAVDPNWLSSLIDTSHQMQADMVSAKFLNYFDRSVIDNLGHQMLNTGEVIPIAHRQPSDLYQKSFHNFGSCAGAALYSVSMLRVLGSFDSFFSTGYEDAELGVRAVVAGYKSVFSPKAIVFHKGGQSIKKVFNPEYALMIQTAIWYTYFKVMPFPVMAVSTPFILLKTILLALINLLFGRWNYLFIQWKSIFDSFTKNRKLILQNRRDFFRKVRPISSWQILKKQRFFLWYDIRRFYRIFIRKNKSAIDQYGGE